MRVETTTRRVWAQLRGDEIRLQLKWNICSRICKNLLSLFHISILGAMKVPVGDSMRRSNSWNTTRDYSESNVVSSSQPHLKQLDLCVIRKAIESNYFLHLEIDLFLCTFLWYTIKVSLRLLSAKGRKEACKESKIKAIVRKMNCMFYVILKNAEAQWRCFPFSDENNCENRCRGIYKDDESTWTAKKEWKCLSEAEG